MASPITWKNINTPNFSGVNQAINQAGDRLSSGLSDARTLLQDNLREDQSNWNQVKDNNTADLLARIQSANSLEDHQALSEALSAQTLQNDYGKQVDTLKVLQAYNKRDNTIRSDVSEQNQFDDDQTNRAERELKGHIQQLTASKDYATALSTIDQTDGLRDSTKAKLIAAVEASKVGDEDRGWKNYGRAHTRGQNSRLLSQQAEQDKADDILASTLQLDGTEADMRAVITQAGKDANLSNKTVQGMLGSLRKDYRELHSLTEEDQANIDDASDSITRNHAPEVNQIASAQKKIDKARRGVYKYANDTHTPLTHGDVNQQVLKDFKITSGEWLDVESSAAGFGTNHGLDGFSKNMRTVVEHANALGVKEGLINPGQDVDMALVLEAIHQSGLADNDSDGGEFEPEPVMKALEKIIQKTNKGKKLLEGLNQQENVLTSRLSEIDLGKTESIKAIEKGIKLRNKLLAQGRQLGK